MSGGLSIHVVDVSRGVVAAWMRVEVYALDPARKLLASGIVSAKGLVEEPALAKRFAPGYYEAVFHVGAFYRAVGIELPKVPFLDIVTYRFGISNWVMQGLPYYVFSLLFAVVLARRIRSTNLVTIPDKLESAYDRRTALLGSVLTVVLMTPAPYVLMLAILLHLVSCWPMLLCLIAGTPGS